jgi:hypothetical protein
MPAVRAAATAALAALLVLAGCGGDDDAQERSGATSTTRAATTTSRSRAPTTTTATAPPPAATTTTAAGCPEPGEPAAGAVTGGDAGVAQHLVEVAVEPAGCQEVVLFTFDRGVPGYRIEYHEGPVVADGSGEVVAIDGDAVLVARFELAYTYDFERNATTYRGPTELRSTGRHVRELELTGNFEGVVTWAVGLAAAVPFTVEETPFGVRVILG